MKIRKNKGFTLIELIIVIVLLGLLAAAALPKFSDLEQEARDASEAGVVGGFRAAIAIAHADWLANSKPVATAIVLEGTSVYMSDPAKAPITYGGWPEDTVAVSDGVMTGTKCLAVYNGILNGPPKATTTCAGGSACEVKAEGALTTCTYTFVNDTGGNNSFTYNIDTGAIVDNTQ